MWFHAMAGVVCFCLPLTLVVLTCSGCHSSTTSREPPHAVVTSGRIAVLGDSLAVSPTSDAGFPSVLQTRLREGGLSWTVVNASIRGDTSAGGLRRIDRVLAAERPNILILALGANDGLRGMDITQMSRNLNEVIARAKAQGVRVLLCGMELPPIRGWGHGRSFRNTFSELADAHDLPLVPFLLAGVALNRDMNGEDGIHPNAAGAQRIAETIWPYLEPLVKGAAR